VALYGLRRQAGLGLQAIARRMGLSYSGVSRRVSAVGARLVTDRRFRRRVESALDVKVKTSPHPLPLLSYRTCCPGWAADHEPNDMLGTLATCRMEPSSVLK